MGVVDWFRSTLSKSPSKFRSPTADRRPQNTSFLSNWFWTRRMSISVSSHQLDDGDSLDSILSNAKFRDRIDRLKINNTDIMEIPVNIAYFTNLTILNLSCNRIADLTWSIVYLKQLVTLDLSHNELTLLPNTIGHLTALQVLRLQRNKLQTLPTSLLQLTQLKELTLAENPLISPSMEICLQGPQSVFQALSTREGRVNIWSNWMPWISTKKKQTQMPTLLELCVNCVFDYDIDFLNTMCIPPKFKNELTEQKRLRASAICVAKCSQCQKFYSNKHFFETHTCKKQSGNIHKNKLQRPVSPLGTGVTRYKNLPRSVNPSGICVAKCSQCQRFFSNMTNKNLFETHTCDNSDNLNISTSN